MKSRAGLNVDSRLRGNDKGGSLDTSVIPAKAGIHAVFDEEFHENLTALP